MAEFYRPGRRFRTTGPARLYFPLPGPTVLIRNEILESGTLLVVAEPAGEPTLDRDGRPEIPPPQFIAPDGRQGWIDPSRRGWPLPGQLEEVRD